MRKSPRKPGRLRPASQRQAISRREYADIVARLGGIELQVRRNRSDLDQQLTRITQLQLELDALKKPQGSTLTAGEIPALPAIGTTPVVES